MSKSSLNDIIERTTEFTRDHMMKHFENKNDHPIAILFITNQKIHLQLTNYVMVFLNAVFLKEFFNEFNRFPGKDEMKNTKKAGDKLLDSLKEEILNYKLDGTVNIL